MPATRPYQNVYGRRWGRGLRPWLLIPKFAGAGLFMGGLASLLVLSFLEPPPADADQWRRHADLIHRAYTRLIVPALVGTLIFGVLLSLAHPIVFLRMRWLQAKLALIVVFVPTLHIFMAGRSAALREAIARGDFAAAALLREQLFRGTMTALAFALTAIVLGRLKPRLGQDYGRTFGQAEPRS